ALDRAGCRTQVDVAEIDNYPYSCWRLGPARIRPIVKKRWLQIAAFPGNRIDNGEAYKFYAEGVTPAVARLYRAINAERVAVAAALGAVVPTLEDWFARTYGIRGADLSETCQLLTTNPDGPYQATGPPSAW